MQARKVLEQEFHAVTGRELTDMSADVFELGLDSLGILSLLGGLREAGYNVSLDDLLSAASMKEFVATMANAE
ncbi:phosphopantetheine-binding protein [Nonomuraea sp. NPDC050783]|uniref:phosphopantetheine-binding protein n=1 Tax=Nonomuraea sp. NPDC050783 TaxID=3154634 RepID=UPI003465553D